MCTSKDDQVSLEEGPGPARARLFEDRELENLASMEVSSPLRRGPGRETFRWTSASGLETIVKRYHGGPGLEGWRERLHGGQARRPARREFELLRDMGAQGLPVSRPLAYHVGRAAREVSLLIMERVEHRETLRERLTREPSEASVWFAPVLELVLGLHDGGWYHRDLYLDHLLVATGSGGEHPVLIDVGRARRDRHPRLRWFVKDLAALWHSLPSGVDEGLALRFGLSWLRARGERNPAARRRFLKAVRAKEERMAGHTPKGGTSFSVDAQEAP